MVWYLKGESVAARARIAAFFGVNALCFSDLSSIAAYEGYNLLSLLN